MALRIAILIENARTLPAYEALARTLLERGHAVHLSLADEVPKDRDGVVARLSAAHLEATAGQAPRRQDRWAPLLSDMQRKLYPAPRELSETEDAEEDAPEERRPAGVGSWPMALAAPLAPEVATYLGQLDLDLLVLTARSRRGSTRLDYLAAARAVGVRVARLAAPGEAETACPARSIAFDPFEADPERIGAIADILEAEAAGPPAPPDRRAAWRPVLEAAFLYRTARWSLEEALGADMRRGIALGLLRSAGRAVQDLYANWIFPPLLKGLLSILPRRRELLRDVLAEQFDIDEVNRLAWVEAEIDRARRRNDPIFFGPWTGGVGHEILYWIPFVRWFRKYYRIDKSRVVVISRGGVRTWYSGILGHYLDVFDLVPMKREEYRRLALSHATTYAQPLPAIKIDREVYKEAARLIEADRYAAFHPQIMFKLFKRRWNHLAGETFTDRYTRLQSVEIDTRAAEKRLEILPERYVVVGLFFNEDLPDSPAARSAIARFVKRLAEDVEVFLIEPPGALETSATADIPAGPRIHRTGEELRPNEALAVQSALIAGAEAFVGTHSGMTYVGQAHGKTTIAVRGRGTPVSEGMDELTRIAPDPAGGRIRIFDVEELEAVAGFLGEAVLAPPKGAVERLPRRAGR